jgi:hypothetical protein
MRDAPAGLRIWNQLSPQTNGTKMVQTGNQIGRRVILRFISRTIWQQALDNRQTAG